ncbi:KTSC domain-containing protein [Nonomuraea sp. SYSU D8015]|uniref:KTSC domain-containing protein n=1 Tax=Nonomuraea sp. SYSU D8015 TaxID=2593644 RepID=UPI001CB6D542|nr:KTSC domain-containing protein [Nonomuraea sp. SYSU D8015]
MAEERREPIPSWDDLARYAKSKADEWSREFLSPPPRDEDGNELPRIDPRVRTRFGQDQWDHIEWAEDQDEDDLLPYRPTPSSFPPRPRTQAAGYSRRRKELRVQFRDGSRYVYYQVPPNVWKNFKRVKSPGRFINRVLNHYSYERETEPLIDDRIYDRFRTKGYRTANPSTYRRRTR